MNLRPYISASPARKLLYALLGVWFFSAGLIATPRFISLENGLSNTSIHAFFQDSQNYVWILTDNGLNRLSGEDIKVFNQSFTDKNALPNNYLIDFYQDSHGNYWIGTLNGLFTYDRVTEKFSSCFTDKFPFISNTKISRILEDKQENVWVVLSGKGLLRIHLKDGEVTSFDLPSINEMDVTTIMLDNDGNVWLAGKHNGIAIFHPDTRILENLVALNNSCRQLADNPIFSLCEDNQGNILAAALGKGLFRINRHTYETQELDISANNPAIRMAICMVKDQKNRIWIGTDGNGLWLLDESNDKLSPYDSPNFGFNPMKGKVQALYEDRHGNIWVAYVEKGAMVIPASDDAFKVIQYNPFNGLDFSDQSVTALLIDQEQTLWLGTNGGGLFRLKCTGDSFRLDCKVDIEESVITCLFQDSRGNVYIGTYLHGFYRYDIKKKTMESFPYKPNNTRSVNCNHVTGFAEDHEGNLYISTNGGGVNLLDTKTGEFRYFRQTGSPARSFLISDWCNCLLIDSQNTLWVGSYAGLSAINLTTKEVSAYTLANGKLSNNAVVGLEEDNDGNIWIATNWGLNKVDRTSGEVHLYTQAEGLTDNVITGFRKDLSRRLWISTNSGLARYLPEEDLFESYDFRKGAIRQEFKLRAVTINSSGDLYWGGTNGIIWFNPDRLGVGNSLLGVTLSNFYLFNDPLEVGKTYHDRIILDKALPEMDQIVLSYNQNNFSFSFDAFDCINPNMVRYAYRLQGLDEKWQYLKTANRMATYTNVPPGHYTFQVKAFTSQEDIRQVEIGIHVTPPWWLTIGAKGTYVLLALALSYILYRIIRTRIREKQEILKRKHDEELTQAKLRFFTDISHEIRTPLTLVISPLLKLIQEDKDPSRAYVYQLMYKNANRILRLVNQLLDIRKIDKKQMKLRVQETDVIAFLSDIIESFIPLSGNRDITLEFASSGQIPDMAWLDVDFMDKIIYNLLSNAFKFTPKGGRIKVSLQLSDNNRLRLCVKDTGRGIPPYLIKNIFERFYQISETQDKVSRERSGSGIGLNLTKMLVELHHGEIRVESEEGKGSLFTIEIPYRREDYREDERSNIPSEYVGTSSMESIHVLLDDLEGDKAGENDKSPHARKSTILIVEDNTDIRSMLRQELRQRFRILESPNGKEGYELAVTHLPDLIITDIMMPVMDGLDMTRRLRSNKNTRQIPIVMLTAKTTSADSIEGVEAGADVYITKPFDLRYLMVNIVNLLHKQALSKIKYDTGEEPGQSGFDVKSADDKLIERLNNIIKKHLDDSSLSIESLSSELGISRVHLHRKLKELCKLTPSLYLRNMRLEHAAYLLRTKRITIAEVAYAVGFNSHQYFSNCFKDFYGMSPMEYAESHRDRDKANE